MPLEEGTKGSPKKEDLFTVKLQICFKSKRKRKSSVKGRKKAKEKESTWSKIGRKKKKKKVPGQGSEESKRKRKFPIRIEIKQKEIYIKVFEPDNVSINIQIFHKPERKERKPWLVTHKAVPFFITNQNILCQ